ncbi:Endolytic murein transglycosylase [Streptomyces hirsutus]
MCGLPCPHADEHSVTELDPTDAPGAARPRRDRGRRGRYRRGGAPAHPGRRRRLPPHDPGHPGGPTGEPGVRGGRRKALELPAGTTKKSLAKVELKLPGDADGNPEGYLFPATYPLKEKATPEQLLALMVETANKKFNGAPTAAGAQRNAMNVYQAVTIASIVQAEASSKADMGKVARVIFNRLERGMPLQMDSTVDYALGRSTPGVKERDIAADSPYNSYARMGLPPTPIDNPGEEAMRAAINPTPGDWLYFITVKPGDTRFTADYNKHRSDLAEFSSRQQKGKQEQGQERKEKQAEPGEK